MIQIGNATFHFGDCIDVMRGMDAGSVDAIVTDPPAGINFMGKEWDHNKGGRAQWIAWMTAVAAECLRVLKPGGHALVWAIPRTSHWTATAWEDAGFEIRDRSPAPRQPFCRNSSLALCKCWPSDYNDRVTSGLAQQVLPWDFINL